MGKNRITDMQALLSQLYAAYAEPELSFKVMLNLPKTLKEASSSKIFVQQSIVFSYFLIFFGINLILT